MAGKLLTRLTNSKEITVAPFEVFYGTGAPSGGTGSNGDYFFRYHDGAEAIYKKYSGAWNIISGVSFDGFDTSTNAQLFTLVANTSSTVVSTFTIATGSKLKVQKDGIEMYEGSGWTRNTGTNAIDFDDTILADAAASVLVFVGLYS